MHIIDSGNGLLPVRHQAIIWTNADLLTIGPWRTKFSESLIEIWAFSIKKIHLKMLSARWMPFCRHFWLTFFCDNCSSLIQFSLKFVPKGLINNKPLLVQTMAWRQTFITATLDLYAYIRTYKYQNPTHLAHCRPSARYSLVQILSCCLFSTKLLYEPMLIYC